MLCGGLRGYNAKEDWFLAADAVSRSLHCGTLPYDSVAEVAVEPLEQDWLWNESPNAVADHLGSRLRYDDRYEWLRWIGNWLRG
jgi:hypothetical protein